MNHFLRIEASLIGLIRCALGLVMIFMVILNLINATGRYGGTPVFTGADELLVFGMIWIVMIGSIVATRDRKHLCIDVFPQRLTVMLRLALSIIMSVVTAGLSAFIAFYSLDFIGKIADIGQTSMGLGIPMVIPHFAVFTGFSGMALVAGILAVSDFRELLMGNTK